MSQTNQKVLNLHASDMSVTRGRNHLMTIKLRIASTKPNLNGEGVTEAFIDQVIADSASLVGIPLVVDIDALRLYDFADLSHMYDEETQRYGTTMIGAFTSFEKVKDEYGVSLYGEARIPKRDDNVVNAIMCLWNMGALKFSCEIRYRLDGVIQSDDGVIYIDANPDNALTGVAIVTDPAYPEAVALDLVAERAKDDADEEVNKPMDKMNDENIKTENLDAEVKPVEEPVEEKANAEVAEEPKEQEAPVKEDANAEVENPEDPEKDKDEKEANANSEERKVRDMDDPAAHEHDGEMDAETEAVSNNARIVELEAEVATLKAELETFRAEKAARELAEKVSKAQMIAERNGLDLNDETVKGAVETANFEMLAELQLAKPVVEEDKEVVTNFSTLKVPEKETTAMERMFKHVRHA